MSAAARDESAFRPLQNNPRQAVSRGRPALFVLLTCLLFFSFHPASSRAAADAVAEITVKPDQSLRDIARQYLHDPELWEDILRANHLTSPHEVAPGMTLLIPVGEIFEANAALKKAAELIHQATQAGARVFAPEMISDAAAENDAALEKRRAGNWGASRDQATAAATLAAKALDISRANQDSPVEAIVDHLQGQVHARKASDNAWQPVSKQETLAEGERIRTLSRSFADIVFRDDSRLQLKENSQAMIQKMRANLLEDTEEAKVSLIQGDVLALLSGRRAGRFEVDVPGVDTKINSQNFWIGRDGKVTRFANYEGELEVSSAGTSVTLKENQGSIVQENEKPSAPLELLPSPGPLLPADNETLFDAQFIFSWSPVEGAVSYLIELSEDAAFSAVVWSEMASNPMTLFPKDLAHGAYYWRVSAVSSDGLPGKPGPARFFRLTADDRPPFLVVRFPEEKAAFSNARLTVSGTAEAGASVAVQQAPAETSDAGEFQSAVTLKKGENRISVRATDPAGNVSEVTRTVYFFPEGAVPLIFDAAPARAAPGHFVVRQADATLSGKTAPRSSVSIASASGDFSAQTSSDAAGRFSLNIPLSEKKEAFSLDVRAPSGSRRTSDIIIETDEAPPRIRFEPALPNQIGALRLTVAGTLEDGEELLLNGRALALEDGRFTEVLELEPGSNVLHFQARDLAGNVARIEKDVYADTAPPELVRHELSATGGQKVTVAVQAKDATGYVKVAPFTAGVGKSVLNGYLTLSGAPGLYTGEFRAPEGAGGPATLKSVTLADYLGNKKTYRIGEE